MISCNYCNCGIGHDFYSLTIDNKYICDVCYQYDECTKDGPNRNVPNGPCDNKNCIHRPTLVGEWIEQKFAKNKKNIYKLLKANPSGIGTKAVAEKLDLSISEVYHILSSGVYDQALDAQEDDVCGVVYFIAE